MPGRDFNQQFPSAERGGKGTAYILKALASALDDGRDDGGKERPLIGDAKAPSDCILSCTSQTYSRMAESGDRRTVRFRPTSAGEPGQHCWSAQVPHGLGEQLQQAYVVLPLWHVRRGLPGLRPTNPATRETWSPHDAPSAVSDACGLRFDVTGPFAALHRSRSAFCVEMDPPLSILGRDLRCPPFMVTTWLRQRPPPA